MTRLCHHFIHGAFFSHGYSPTNFCWIFGKYEAQLMYVAESYFYFRRTATLHCRHQNYIYALTLYSGSETVPCTQTYCSTTSRTMHRKIPEWKPQLGACLKVSALLKSQLAVPWNGTGTSPATSPRFWSRMWRPSCYQNKTLPSPFTVLRRAILGRTLLSNHVMQETQIHDEKQRTKKVFSPTSHFCWP